MKMKRDENGVVLPISTTSAPAESVPFSPLIKEDELNFKKEEKSTETQRKAIGKEEIAKAKQTLNNYLASKKLYDQRFKNNYDTYNLMYTENDSIQLEKNDEGNLVQKMIPKKMGAQCLNVIMNKHADAMDNYPEAICLPRSADDEATAKILNSVIPCLLERNGFQNTYSDCWTDKLVGGTGCYAVLWDSDKENGLGDITINKADILSMAWKPFIENIQDSPHLFCMKLYDIEEIKEIYPQLENINETNVDIESYRTYDNENKIHNKAVVVDWYYKKNGLLHLCKWCGDEILFASENESEIYPKGFYEHGLYPFVMDPLFKLRDTPVGFSFVDICRWPQHHLNNLKVDILKNIKVNSQTRNLVNAGAGININDLADLEKDFIECDNINDATHPFESKDIANGALSMYNALIDEMKETTGTNDASNGASAAGVTSGSAIAALQEAGGKISRDANKQGYFAFVEICKMVIELMRQFYTLPRFFRIAGENNKSEFIEFDNTSLMKQEIPMEDNSSDEIFERLPVFDIKVKAQRSSPFTTAANNQMMMDMFGAGMFAPANADASLIALEGMTFEGKEKIVEMIKKNQTLEQTVVELTNKLKMSNAMLDTATAQGMGGMSAVPQNGGAPI